MINYAIELFLIHTSLVGAYWLLLRNETEYHKMRFFLIGSTLAALIIPLLHLPNPLSLWYSNITQASTEVIVLSPTGFPTNTQGYTIGFLDVCWSIYALISGVLLLQFCYNVWTLVKLEKRSKYEKMNDLYVRKVKGIKSSFTFLGWIFIDDNISPDQEEYKAVLRHEQAHVKLGHSYDLLILQLFTTFFWWLPSAWFIRKEIKKIHEFQADAYALTAYPVDWYSSILISSSLKSVGLGSAGLGSAGLGLASSFHYGLTLIRIKAMKQKVTKVNSWKMGTLATISLLMFFLFACTDEMDEDIKDLGKQSNAISFDQLPLKMQVRLMSKRDELTFIRLDIEEGDELKEIMKLYQGSMETSNFIKKDDGTHKMYAALRKEGSNFQTISQKAKMDGDVFTIVTEQPEFPGGMNEYYNYVASEMTYPKQAQEEGISGRVYVQFVVEKDGSIGEVKTVKGIGGGCNEAAEQVVRNSPKFIPGKNEGEPVRVRMVMPIVFHLNEEKSPAGNG